MGERLRARSGKKLSYNEDMNEADWEVEERENIEAKQIPAKKKRLRAESCAICSEKDDLIFCPGCQEAYHLGCLVPPLKVAPRGKWSCPQCVDPLSDIEKFLDCQERLPDTLNDDDDSDSPSPSLRPSKHYLVKWKSKSHLHCSWISEDDLEKAGKSFPGLKMKLNNFRRQMDSLKGVNIEDEWIPIRSEWTTVDRILAHRDTGDITEYLVKWKELGYEEATWEVESDMIEFQEQIDKYNSINTRGSGSTSKKRKGSTLENNDAKSRRKDFKAYDGTPKFLSSGCVLHPYQLEGLNFLRFAWRQGKHVILADEMGLGKTIQSISFLASLKVEGVSLPHLVVAPLSTLRNWEREFATWAPHLNTVMYVGSSAARAVIKEYEFYHPKEKIKMRKKKFKKKKAPAHHESKQDRIKFDILLTSYEMINLDTASLKAIKWECLVVDEGHRLKNKDSKLFQTLKQYSTKHRVLLTGTPLQNNMDELFMLMHFLDAGKFSSLEDFQQEFNDINQEEQIARLHKMLAPHLLRRVKKDVLKDMPPKKELILRVELSPLQKEYYRAILTKNYEALSRRGGAQISLNNVVMELRKLCGHPYMLEGVEPVFKKISEAYRQLVEASGKLMLLDKMMEKLKANGHRVLIYSQFKKLLDILEDWLIYKKWTFERIDGNISGAERQIRIDRFNAKDSTRFCFLLSTRAGGLGINLATADTVIIYDSDWNPHADLQAMARAHRLGQTKKVMIFRLVTRSSIEERMMQLSKKKMVLEHLVVGRLKTQQVLNQEELDDILRYGAKDLFAEENDETKSQQIRYDDAAIDRLLDRSQVENEDASADDDDRDVLKAFKVANFEYVDEEEVAPAQSEFKTGENSEAHLDPNAKANYWDELLKDRYEEHKYEMATELGKGKRTRKQVMPLAEDDLAGMAGISSDEEDDESLPLETNSGMKEANEPATKKSQSSKKKMRDLEPSGPPPLLEGEGKSLKVLGFNRRQRATFVQVLMRFGLGDFSWSEFIPRLKPKTFEEIKEYGTLFLTHIAEEITNSESFSDGVPKEGLSVQDVLVRLAILHLIQDKVKCSLEEPSAPLFSEDVHNLVSALKHPKFWNETHDRRLLEALLKHGYGRWQEIADDVTLGFDSVVCKELQLPPVSSTPIPDATSSHANAISQENIPPRETFEGNRKQDVSPQAAEGISHSGSSGPMRDAHLHKKIAEYIKKRALILERALNAEYHRETSAEQKEEEENIEENIPVEELHVDNDIASLALYADEIARIAYDNDPQRFYIAQVFNEMCKLVFERATDAAETYGGNKSAGIRVRKVSREIDGLCVELRRTILPFVKDGGGGMSINGGGWVGGSSAAGMNRHMEDGEDDLEADLDSELDDLNTPSQHRSGIPQNGAGKQNHPIREPGGGSTSNHGPSKHVPRENKNSFSVEKNSSAFFQASQQSATNTWPPVVILDD